MLLRMLLIATLALPLFAQTAQERKAGSPGFDGPVYKLEYIIAELQGGKRISAQDYSMLVQGAEPVRARWGKVRVGTRVPIETGTKAGETQFQYMDVGVNIDAYCAPVQDTTNVLVETKVEVSSVVTEKQPAIGTGIGGLAEPKTLSRQPTMRNFRTESLTTLPLGKQTLLFSLDEPNSNRAFQVLVTATHVR